MGGIIDKVGVFVQSRRDICKKAGLYKLGVALKKRSIT